MTTFLSLLGLCYCVFTHLQFNRHLFGKIWCHSSRRLWLVYLPLTRSPSKLQMHFRIQQSVLFTDVLLLQCGEYFFKACRNVIWWTKRSSFLRKYARIDTEIFPVAIGYPLGRLISLSVTVLLVVVPIDRMRKRMRTLWHLRSEQFAGLAFPIMNSIKIPSGHWAREEWIPVANRWDKHFPLRVHFLSALLRRDQSCRQPSPDNRSKQRTLGREAQSEHQKWAESGQERAAQWAQFQTCNHTNLCLDL